MRHEHADMIKEYIENVRRTVEWADEPCGPWHQTLSPTWDESKFYRFADRRHQVSGRVMYDNVQLEMPIPEPLTEFPETACTVYAPDPAGRIPERVVGIHCDSARAEQWLRDGIAYLAYEDAAARAECMIMRPVLRRGRK